MSMHLVRRFFRSLCAAPLSELEQAWVCAHLSSSEQVLWRRCGRADQRHAYSVAQRAQRASDEPLSTEVVAAALLHDVGKLHAQLGTVGRTLATLAYALGISRGRIAMYHDHHEIGAAMLTDAQSHPLVIAWAREHELPASQWTIDPKLGGILKAADDE